MIVTRGKADLILKNACIVDVENGTSGPGGIAVSGERILAVGADAEIAALADSHTRMLDLSGKTVVPGFIDAHTHFAWAGQAMTRVDLTGARSVREVLDRVAERARTQPPRTLLRGYGLQDNPAGENRLPNRRELDAVAPDHYVQLFRDDGHASVVNTLTLEFMDYPRDMPGVEREGGEPTGVLREQATYEGEGLHLRIEAPGTGSQGLEAATQAALRVGITTVHVLEGADDQPHEGIARLQRDLAGLPIRSVLWYQTKGLDRVEALGLPRVGGCILLDGAPGSHTGALFEPYSDRPETCGPLYFTDDAINAFVLAAHRKGMQVALHATCQRSIEQCINAYDAALAAVPASDARLRLEHGYGMPTPAQLERMGRLGIILSTQPAFLNPTRLAMYQKRWGERWRRSHPHATALRYGVIIAGGSDCSVTPMDPLSGIWHAVNHPVEEQRVGVREALRWFTINAAYAAFEEADKGSIRPGKLADLTVLGRDPLTENALTLRDIPVAMVIVGGTVRYTGEGAAG